MQIAGIFFSANRLIQRHKKISDFLEKNDELSLKIDSDDEFRKVLILCISSFFERWITEAIMELAQKSNSERVISLIRMKAISRQYHTYFAWKENNINQFLKLFGDSFKEEVSNEISKNEDLKDGAKKFLRLGEKRNILVHENFASATIDWSLDEIIEMYSKSLHFVHYLTDRLVTE